MPECKLDCHWKFTIATHGDNEQENDRINVLSLAGVKMCEIW